MDLRELRQKEAKQAYLESHRKCILNCAPRFGKIKTSIDIMRELNPKRVLISFPRNDIMEGWKSDFKKFRFEGDVDFVTFTSVKKKVDEDYDFFIIDEIQEASRNQRLMMYKLVEKEGVNSLGLSGTITGTTEREIMRDMGMTICFKYEIEKAVAEGVLSDYHIYVHKVDLDDSLKIHGTKKNKTEKGLFQAISIVKDKMKGQQKWFMEMKQIKILQNSLSKLNKTKELIEKYKDSRLLIFTGLTEIANNLGVPVYHSKSKDRQIFLDFCRGVNYNHLATVNMLQAGITILPIDRGIVNYFSGAPEQSTQKICRFLGTEINHPHKKAEIHIVTSTEKFELFRLSTALSFLESSKITYL